MKKPEICLVMIVRDEEDTIEKCIKSVAKYISYWVIVDTGSVDKTKEKIHEVMGELGIPGELHESEWVDFAHNRTENMRLSQGKGDWRFLMDADDEFVSFGENPFESLSDEHNGYHVDIEYGSINFKRMHLFRSDAEWEYEGKRHNYPVLRSGKPSIGLLQNCSIRTSASPEKRAESSDKKYANDAKILLAEHKKDPSNSRTVFYLAQSYRDCNKPRAAINWYKKRAEMGGWNEEVYYSLLQVAELSAKTGAKEDDVLDMYLKAWETRPSRLEACYMLMRILGKNNRHFLAFTYGMMGYNMMLQHDAGNKDLLFVHRDAHKWLFLDEFSLSAYRNGQFETAKHVAESLINSSNWSYVPDNEKERIEKNLGYFNQSIEDKKKSAESVAEVKE